MENREAIGRQLWSDRRRRGSEWRARAVAAVLEKPPVYPPDVVAVVEAGVFTEKQLAAVEMIYGRALSQSEAATALGISRAALRDRLEGANRKLEAQGARTTANDRHLAERGRSNLELRAVLGWDFEGPPPVTQMRYGVVGGKTPKGWVPLDERKPPRPRGGRRRGGSR